MDAIESLKDIKPNKFMEEELKNEAANNRPIVKRRNSLTNSDFGSPDKLRTQKKFSK